ncbi:MAG: DUF4112 domain-containing protein [Opitutus sp.]
MADTRLRRLRGLTWLLDRSVRVGENARFGLDPIIGLIPVVGDWIGALLSLYVVYEGLMLGLPWPVLGRMLVNVGVEALVGAVPLLGDAFDFVWQANSRNLRLVERHYHPRLRPRSHGAITAFLAALVLVVLALTAAATWLFVWLMNLLIQRTY